MTIWTMTRPNGDLAYVRSIGDRYCADVTTHTGGNGNQAWPETYKTATECRQALEKHGFKLA